MKWQLRGECAGDLSEDWYADDLTLDTATACFVCPVRLECLTESLPRHRTWDVGVWGGTTAGTREKIRMKQATVTDAWRELETYVRRGHDGRFSDVDSASDLL
jgi:hypothetical protein